MSVPISPAADARVAYFDYLRALAVTFVVMAHYRNPILPGGSIGVSVFFALSGYLICALLMAQKELTLASCLRFTARRFLRIFPPYAISLALIVGTMAFYTPNSLPAFLDYLPGLLTFTYRPDYWVNLGVGVLWTLQIEFWFYVSFPLLVFFVGRTDRLVIILLALLPISWIVTFIVLMTQTSSSFAPLSAVMWMDSLLVGSIVALLQIKGALTRIAPYAMAIQVSGAIGLLLIARLIPNANTYVWVVEARAASLLAAAMIAAYQASPFEISLPLIGWIGRISYPIYLLHGVLAGYLEIPWMAHAKSLAMLAIVIPASALMHYLIELPSIRMARQLTTRSTAKIMTAPAQPT
jgi:peptidoglycan/LPS O-acetylase OafA/YrhL